MSLVIQVGQCGNQLGQAILQAINSIEVSQGVSLSNFDSFFEDEKEGFRGPNVILVDMEPKVIERLLMDKKGGIEYDPNCAFFKQEGSGNNWAFGFNKHGPDCREKILNVIRKKIEKMQYLQQIIFIQSLAGGTGSGVGSYLLSQMKEEFPYFFYTNILVAPKLSGEVILQFYNSIFSLTSIYANTDHLFLFENDKSQKICQQLWKDKSISIEMINDYISKSITPSFFSLHKVSHESYINNFNYCCPLIEYKVLTAKYIPYTADHVKQFLTDSWNGLASRAHQMVISNSLEYEINWNISSSTALKSKSLAISMTCFSKAKFDKNEIEKSMKAFEDRSMYHSLMANPLFRLNSG